MIMMAILLTNPAQPRRIGAARPPLAEA